MYILADFGKINLKNLQKLQKLDVENSKKVFISRSKVPSKHPMFTDEMMSLHDGLTHTKVKPSLMKYLPQVNYKNTPRDFLHLNPDYTDKNNKKFNNAIESIAVGIEGKGRKSGNSLVILGNSIRKRDLNDVEKLATSWQQVPEIVAVKNKSTPATEDDVSLLIKAFKDNRSRYTNKDRGVRKIKGLKAPERDLEYKKAILEGRYISD